MNWYLAVLKNYVGFSGRARRKEYWTFLLFNILIGIVLGIIEGIVGIAPESDTSVLAAIYALAVFLPALAVGVRRLHDIGRGGGWLLIGLVPIIGVIVLLVFLAKDSQSGDNEYGPNPKALD